MSERKNELEKARARADAHRAGSNAKGDYLQRAIAQRDSARALLRKTVPHIKRARAAYKDGWIEEKQEILSEIAAELGEVT